MTSKAKNLMSALQNPEAVDTKLRKELEANRLSGPYRYLLFPIFRVSPLEVVPKKTPGEFRLIHHLSFPKGFLVNDGIPTEHTSVSYASIGDAIRLIKLAGPGCFLAKTDIKNAFRIIPINPADYNLLGMCWNGLYYYDRCMPMGCSSSCRTFSTAVEWIAHHKLKIDHILHLLDDFLIVAPASEFCQPAGPSSWKHVGSDPACFHPGSFVTLDITFGCNIVHTLAPFTGLEFVSSTIE